MQSHELEDLLARYERGECSPQEEKLIHEWYQNVSVEHERPIDESDIEKRVWASVRPPVSGRKPFYYKAAAVISFLIIAGSAYISWSEWNFSSRDQMQVTSVQVNPEHYTNTTAKAIDVSLRDGSKVTLQPGSRISVSSTEFNTDKREVFLSGQAFFDVKKDSSRPFLVYSRNVATRVLGTSFCIKAYDQDDEITVTVMTGKVSVFTGYDNQLDEPITGKETILTPNQKLVYNTNERKVQKGIVQKPAIVLAEPTLFAMKYDGAPVTKILEVLDENYGIEIQYDEEILEGCILTTSMTDEDFYERIEILCKAINATYEVVDGAVVITSEGCN